MAELIFILTTLFVAYVVFVVVDGEKKLGIGPEPKPENSKPDTAAEIKTKAASQQKVATKPSASTSTSSPVSPVASSAAEEIDSIKNPETGEVVKVPNNYRFAKRWVKQALVSEGLLDKIYKATELDDEVNAKIQQAINQLKIMPKYH